MAMTKMFIYYIKVLEYTCKEAERLTLKKTLT